MTNLTKTERSLPSVERASEWIQKCRDTRELDNIRSVAQAVALRTRGTLLECEARTIINEADRRKAALEAEERAGRPKVNEQGRTGYRLGNPLPKSQLVAESKRAPLARVPEPTWRRLHDMSIKAMAAVSSASARAFAAMPEPQQKQTIAKIGELRNVALAIRAVKLEGQRASLESVAAREVKAAAGVYDVIVIDPPWAMEKTERDLYPNQTAFDYPTMTEAELAAMRVPCADDCHVWVWTTHKFLPMALRLLEAWDLKYVCTFVWHKPGGFQQFGLPQYNCEFALYARRGTPSFIDTKAFFTCFEAPRGKHSEKPEAFYETVRRVTAGRRLDMFNRRSIDGFDGWGNESELAATQ